MKGKVIDLIDITLWVIFLTYGNFGYFPVSMVPNSYNILLDNIFGSVAPNQSHRDKHVIGMISQEMFRKYVLKHKSAKLLGKLLKSSLAH